MMHRWIVGRKRPDLLLLGLCIRVLLWICGLDATLADHSALCNCSKHERYTRNYDYMEGGDVRTRRLYSRTQWFLTIDEYGNINGTQDPNNCYSILEIRTVSEGGILAIKGVKSQYYISMSRGGLLQGKKDYSDSCNFKEVFLENFYTAYLSDKWTKTGKEMFISLSQKGRPLKGKKNTQRDHRFALHPTQVQRGRQDVSLTHTHTPKPSSTIRPKPSHTVPARPAAPPLQRLLCSPGLSTACSERAALSLDFCGVFAMFCSFWGPLLIL
uniref:Fibroblast growth factor n=1 Tax=Pygocentrus nattereri TaxID=42514 RepID=A0AAR2LJU3_PYGNA